MTPRSRYASMLKILIILVGWHVSSAEAFNIFGMVNENATGDPVEFVNVQVYFNGNPVGGANDITDNNGEYFISGIPGGTYDVDFQPPQDSGLRPKYVTDVIVVDDVELNVNLVHGNKIYGYVRDTSGNGIPEIDLNIYDQFTGEQLDIPNDDTDFDGYYDVFVPDGIYRIVYRGVGEPPPRYVSVEMTNVEVTQDINIDVVLEDGLFITGIVTGPNGPVPNADIDVEDSDTGEKIFTPGDNTDSDGFYRVIVPAGTFDIGAAPPEGERLVPAIVYEFQVSQDATLNFVLETGVFLSGTVRDPQGSAVQDADIDVIDPSTGEKLFTPGARTNQTGNYLVVIPAGVYDIDYRPPVVSAPYLACLRLQNQNIMGDAVIDVTVPYGILLSGLVVNNNAVGIRAVDIDAIDPPTDMTVPLVGDYTDELGAFATVLVAGVYHLEIEPPRQRRLAPELLPDYPLYEDTYIEVTVDTGMVVTGTVTSPAGDPMPDVRVTAVESSSQQQAFTPGNRTDLSGLYEILIKPDTYDLTYSPDPSHGFPDSTLYDRQIETDVVINVQFSESEPDTEPPVVTVLSPNGGENWLVYSNQIISWTASDNIGVTSIDLYYSTSGSNGPYELISADETNDGSYDWNVPPTPTEDGWVRIVAHDASSNSGEDISNAAFTIYANPSDCSYIPGDTDHNGTPIELGDVIAMIGIYRGTNSPYYICDCSPHGADFAPETDPNGNCVANELSDVVTEIGAYRGTATVSGCVDCPGLRRMQPNGGKSN